MKLNDLYPSNYLKKEDVLSPITVTIRQVTQEEISGDGGKELKAVLHFVGATKPMVLNKGNAITISESFGDDTDAWPGKTIEVYHDPSVMFAGKRIGGVRVRMPTRNTLAQSSTTNGHPELWDISDGQTVLSRKTSDEVREFLANTSVPVPQIKLKPAGAARDMAKPVEQWGFVVAVGAEDDSDIPF